MIRLIEGSFGRRRVLLAASCLALTSLLFTPLISPAFARDKPLDAKLVRLDGEKVKLSELRGKPVLLDLWASWCLPCQEQSAILKSLGAELEAAGANTYAVNVGEDLEVVRQHLEHHPVAFPVLLDRWQTIATKLQVGELPVLVLLDADGSVVAIQAGLAQREAIVELLGQLSPKDSE